MSPSMTGQAVAPRPPCPAIACAVPERLRPAALPTGCLQSVIDALDVGVLVCDERGRLLLANAAARRELAAGGVLQLTEDGALDVCGGAGLLLLRRAVHAAARARAYQLVPLRRGERRLMVSVQPMRATDGAPPSALLLLGRRRLCPELAVQELGRLYELTTAERRVLAGLLAGMAVAAMARERGVAVSTVRTQVAALRAKFGVRRIDNITRLVGERQCWARCRASMRLTRCTRFRRLMQLGRLTGLRRLLRQARRARLTRQAERAVSARCTADTAGPDVDRSRARTAKC